jgi:hypothetical protein
VADSALRCKVPVGLWIQARVLMNIESIKQPSALLPIAMSAAAFTLVVGHLAIYGAVREADEGTAAHLWQLLMAGQVPIILYFALRWLSQAPAKGLVVLALQVAAALAACAPVFIFQL